MRLANLIEGLKAKPPGEITAPVTFTRAGGATEFQYRYVPTNPAPVVVEFRFWNAHATDEDHPPRWSRWHRLPGFTGADEPGDDWHILTTGETGT